MASFWHELEYENLKDEPQVFVNLQADVGSNYSVWRFYYCKKQACNNSNERNDALYQKYEALAGQETNVIFGGRLGSYKYYDMDKVIEAALQMCEAEL